MYPGLDSKDSDLISLVKENTRKALADKTSTTQMTTFIVLLYQSRNGDE